MLDDVKASHEPNLFFFFNLTPLDLAILHAEKTMSTNCLTGIAHSKEGDKNAKNVG